jgi:predicted ArsR family transcriptional regulator
MEMHESQPTQSPMIPVDDGHWTFLSNHAHVLVCVAKDADARVRDIAQHVGITERAVQRILGELESAGVIARERHGRRTRYRLDAARPLRHPLERERTIGELLELLLGHAPLATR